METEDTAHDDKRAISRAQNENARRAARFRFAQDRIKKIVDGMPPLTDEQLQKLVILLRPDA